MLPGRLHCVESKSVTEQAEVDYSEENEKYIDRMLFGDEMASAVSPRGMVFRMPEACEPNFGELVGLQLFSIIQHSLWYAKIHGLKKRMKI